MELLIRVCNAKLSCSCRFSRNFKYFFFIDFSPLVCFPQDSFFLESCCTQIPFLTIDPPPLRSSHWSTSILLFYGWFSCDRHIQNGLAWAFHSRSPLLPTVFDNPLTTRQTVDQSLTKKPPFVEMERQTYHQLPDAKPRRKDCSTLGKCSVHHATNPVSRRGNYPTVTLIIRPPELSCFSLRNQKAAIKAYHSMCIAVQQCPRFEDMFSIGSKYKLKIKDIVNDTLFLLL